MDARSRWKPSTTEEGCRLVTGVSLRRDGMPNEVIGDRGMSKDLANFLLFAPRAPDPSALQRQTPQSRLRLTLFSMLPLVLAGLLVPAVSALVLPPTQHQLPFLGPHSDASVLLSQLEAAQPQISAYVHDDQVHVRHQDFPDHRVRLVKPAKLECDDTVEQWSGYLDVESKKHHLFFWWFGPRSPSEHVMAWHNGGPVRFLSTVTVLDTI